MNYCLPATFLEGLSPLSLRFQHQGFGRLAADEFNIFPKNAEKPLNLLSSTVFLGSHYCDETK